MSCSFRSLFSLEFCIINPPSTTTLCLSFFLLLFLSLSFCLSRDLRCCSAMCSAFQWLTHLCQLLTHILTHTQSGVNTHTREYGMCLHEPIMRVQCAYRAEFGSPLVLVHICQTYWILIHVVLFDTSVLNTFCYFSGHGKNHELVLVA